MATRTQVRVLEAILTRGPWKRPRDLMEEALATFPFEFEELSQTDANRTIDYGNEVLGKNKEVHYLRSVDLAPYLSEEDDTPEGRCVDMWQEEIQDEISLDIFEKAATMAFTYKRPEEPTINPFIDSEVDFSTEVQVEYDDTGQPMYVAYDDAGRPICRTYAAAAPMPTEPEAAPELPVSEAKTYTYSTETEGFEYATEIEGVEYDDTGQPMYIQGSEKAEVVEARKRLRDRSEELRRTIKDKKALKEELKKSKRAIGYETSKRIAEERKHRQKLKTFATMYGVRTGRTIFKKRT